MINWIVRLLQPPDKNANRNEGALVYASLDLPNGGEARPPTRHPPPRRDDRTEYAEIQFQPPKLYEQASLWLVSHRTRSQQGLPVFGQDLQF